MVSSMPMHTLRRSFHYWLWSAVFAGYLLAVWMAALYGR